MRAFAIAVLLASAGCASPDGASGPPDGPLKPQGEDVQPVGGESGPGRDGAWLGAPITTFTWSPTHAEEQVATALDVDVGTAGNVCTFSHGASYNSTRAGTLGSSLLRVPSGIASARTTIHWDPGDDGNPSTRGPQVRVLGETLTTQTPGPNGRFATRFDTEGTFHGVISYVSANLDVEAWGSEIVPSSQWIQMRCQAPFVVTEAWLGDEAEITEFLDGGPGMAAYAPGLVLVHVADERVLEVASSRGMAWVSHPGALAAGRLVATSPVEENTHVVQVDAGVPIVTGPSGRYTASVDIVAPLRGGGLHGVVAGLEAGEATFRPDASWRYPTVNTTR